MEETSIKSFVGLAELVDEHRKQNWLYRGVKRSDYKLIPKIGRSGSTKKGLKYTEKAEKNLFREFKRQARSLVDREDLSALEWLTIAQHHELKTRLLDWTESVFIAAFFATESGVATEFKIVKNIVKEFPLPPVIYGIRDLPMASSSTDPFDLDEVMAYHPSNISSRIAPQMAAFTIHPEPSQVFDIPEIVRWKLNIRGTVKIKLALDASGFTRASLFPGIDGLAKALNWQHKWDRLRV